MPSIAGNPISDVILLMIVLSFLWGVLGTHQRRRNLKRFWRGWGRGPDWHSFVKQERMTALMDAVAPHAAQAEKNRKRALYITLGGFVLWCVVNAYIYHQIKLSQLDPDTQVYTLLSVVLLFFPNHFYHYYIKISVMPKVAEALGYHYRRYGLGLFKTLRNYEDDIVFASGKRFALGRSSLLLGDYDGHRTEDGFTSLENLSHESTPWQTPRRPRISMEELQTYTERRDKRSDRRILQFKGLLVQIDFHEEFACPILLREDLGDLLSKMSFPPPGMQSIKLEDPQFENLFEVYGADQVSSRRILTPRFMEKVKELAGLYRAPVEVLFVRSSVFIAVRTSRNHFELGHVLRPIASPKALGRVLAQIELQHQVAESLKG